jgi:hypothetical protein
MQMPPFNSAMPFNPAAMPMPSSPMASPNMQPSLPPTQPDAFNLGAPAALPEAPMQGAQTPPPQGGQGMPDLSALSAMLGGGQNPMGAPGAGPTLPGQLGGGVPAMPQPPTTMPGAPMFSGNEKAQQKPLNLMA